MNEQHLHYPGWRVAVASGVAVFFWSLPPYSFAVFLKPMAEEFGLSRQAVSSVFGISPFVGALSAVPIGYLLDRMNPRRIFIPCLALVGCAFALRALLAPPYWHFAALFALSGAVSLGASPVAFARVVTTWFDRRRGVALGLAIAGAGMGAMLHPPVAQALIDAYGWRQANLVLGALVVVVGVPVAARFVTARAAAPAPTGQAQAAPAGASARQGMRSRIFWVLAVVVLCDSIANSSMTVHLPALLTDRGVSGPLSAVALSVLGASAVIGRLATGWLLDRCFGAHVSVALLVVSSAGVYLLADAESFATGAFAAMCLGLGMGGEADVTPYLLSRYFGLRAFSTLYGSLYGITGLAWAVGPALMGRTFDATGSYASHLVGLAIMLLAAAGLMFTLPRYVPGTALVGGLTPDSSPSAGVAGPPASRASS